MKKKKEKRDKRVFWFMDFVYNQEFCVIIVPTHKQFAKIAKDEIGFEVEPCDFLAGEFHGLTNENHPSLALVWSSDKDINLTHELFHACAWTLRTRGLTLSQESEEAYAYYLTYLFRQVRENIK